MSNLERSSIRQACRRGNRKNRGLPYFPGRAQIHGSAPFSEGNPHHPPSRIGGVGRVEIPDSPHEGRDGSAGGLALPFRIPCSRKIRSVAKRGRAPPAAASQQRLHHKMLEKRHAFLDRGWVSLCLTRGFGTSSMFQASFPPRCVNFTRRSPPFQTRSSRTAGQFTPSVRLRCKRRGHLPFRRQEGPPAGPLREKFRPKEPSAPEAVRTSVFQEIPLRAGAN